jgi:hypothetical protein
MSKDSERYEQDVAYSLNKLPGVSAVKKGSNAYSDVFVKYNGGNSWLEIKMNHSDSLFNSRLFYSDEQWKTTYAGEAAKTVVDMTNDSDECKKFLSDICVYTGIVPSTLKIPTTKGGLVGVPGAVPYDRLREFFLRCRTDQYLVKGADINLGALVQNHYLTGKTEKAYYIQTGDDFFRISNADPLKLGTDIPVIQGSGAFKIRVLFTDGVFYEVVPELKMKNLMSSKYSVKPGSKKINPFVAVTPTATPTPSP